MSEEKINKHKSSRIISITALVIGIAAFMCGLLIVPAAGFMALNPSAFKGEGITRLIAVVAYYSLVSFWYITIPGLILSMVALFIERNKYYRFLPLPFVLIGILLYAVCYNTVMYPP
jgi:hypothetical protein